MKASNYRATVRALFGLTDIPARPRDYRLVAHLRDLENPVNNLCLEAFEVRHVLDELHRSDLILRGETIPDFGRASGEMKCVECNQELWRHPDCPAPGWEGRPFLKILCCGTVVKL